MPTTGARALTAFNPFSGAFGFATGLVGLFSPDPLQDEVDDIGEDLAEIKGQISGLSTQLSNLNEQIAQELDGQRNIPINSAIGDMQDAKAAFNAVRRTAPRPLTRESNSPCEPRKRSSLGSGRQRPRGRRCRRLNQRREWLRARRGDKDKIKGNGAPSAAELRLQSLGGSNAVLVEADRYGNGEADLQIFVNLTTNLGSSDFIF